MFELVDMDAYYRTVTTKLEEVLILENPSALADEFCDLDLSKI